MDEIQKKSHITRQRNQEARAALYEEQAAATRAARQALQRIFESTDATLGQILEAAQLLAKIAGH